MKDPEKVSDCHTPEPGEPDDVWWFGFDCAHGFDVMPGHDALLAALNGGSYGEAYRDMPYVRAEVEKLAGFLVAFDKPAAAG